MNAIWMILFLLLGLYLAVKLTQLVNWFTFGQNAARRMEQDNKEPAPGKAKEE